MSKNKKTIPMITYHDYSIPECLLNYLNVLSISLSDYDEVTSFFFDGNQLTYSKDGNDLLIREYNCDTYLAKIVDGTDLYFNVNGNTGSVCYNENQLKLTIYNREFKLELRPDMLGNVSVSFSSFADNYLKQIINIGEENIIASNYLLEMKEKLNDNKQYTKYVDVNINAVSYSSQVGIILGLVQAMFEDSRIIIDLIELINNMAPDLETALENKIAALNSFYDAQLNEAVVQINDMRKSAIADLLAYKYYISRRNSEDENKDKGAK